jgi:D-tyrosyl-tRNA(Tyr) deacylase
VRALLQRVTSASVEIDAEIVGSIQTGWLVLLGVGTEDEPGGVDAFVDKVVGLRCFEDAEGKTNLSAADVGAAFLVVSQFTLYADTSRGRRPGFSRAARPDLAVPVVDAFVAALKQRGFHVQTGRFGAHMRVALVNDGPFTIWLDSASS